MNETSSKFRISATGALTGKPYNGDFEVKTMPSFQDEMDFDAYFADILGPRPANYVAPIKIHNYAFMLAFIQSRLLQAPDWWQQTRGGRDIEKGDLNVITEVFTKTSEAEAKAQEEIVAEGEKAKTSLKKSPVKEG